MTLAKLPTFKPPSAQVLGAQTKPFNDFQFSPVEVDLRRLPRKYRELLDGEGLERYGGDRSRAVQAVARAMLKADYSEQETLSALTDRKCFLGEVAYEHAGKTKDRVRAARWLHRYTLRKARESLAAQGIVIEAIEAEASSKGKISAQGKLNLKLVSYERIKMGKNVPALIGNWLAPESVALLLAESGVGKTFVALDMAFAIARGTEWQDNKTLPGLVLFLALEGGQGIINRICAYKKEHELEDADIPFILARGSFDLLSAAQVGALIEEIHTMAKDSGQPVRLIVIDTLSRALQGADENSATDMGDLVKSVDRIRLETKATVLLTHHLGKDVTRGARGHSILKAAADSELTLTRKGNGTLCLESSKQRDLDVGTRRYSRLKTVELGKSDGGTPFGSCVVEQLGGSIEVEEDTKPKLARGTAQAFDVLKSLKNGTSVVSVTNWREAFFSTHFRKSPKTTKFSAFGRAVEALYASGFIAKEGNNVRILAQK